MQQNEFWKQPFWVLSGVVVLLGLGSWIFTTSQLSSTASENAKKIKQKYTEVTDITKNANHPNSEIAASMEKLIGKVGVDVGKGWEAQYRQQESLFQWPATLNEGLREDVAKMRPIESVDKSRELLSDSSRQHYADTIGPEIEALAKPMKSKWIKSIGSSSSNSKDETEDDKPADDWIVAWSARSQADLFASHFSFAGVEGSKPSTFQVLYAQEDLWILNSIVETIGRVNGAVDNRFEAPIMEVQTLAIGEAAFDALTATAKASSGGGGGGGASRFKQTGPSVEEMMEIQKRMIAGNTADAGKVSTSDKDPADGRYVDEDFKKLDGVKLRKALTSKDPKDAKYAVAKRVPIHLRLRMDQRKLQTLIAECGNARIPIEIRRVRINPGGQIGDSVVGDMTGEGGSGASKGTGDAASDFQAEQMEKMKAIMSAMKSSSKSAAVDDSKKGGKAITVDLDNKNIAAVELVGIMYVYNPVNWDQLGVKRPTAAESTSVPNDPSRPMVVVGK